MNDNPLFNDTFDNLTFSETDKLLKSRLSAGDANVLNKLNTKDVSRKSIENISLDDSIFFGESFTLPLAEGHANRTHRTSSEDIFSGSETFLENLSIGEDCLLKERNVSNSRCRLKSTSSENGLKPEELATELSTYDLACEAKSEVQKIHDLSDWGLPEMILQKYNSRGIKSMFAWQSECLSNRNILEQNKNLVYSAPTSAGKTLVAEILTIKTVLERNKKVLFILPFISVVREKMYYFQDILSSSGVRVEGYMGSYNPPGGFQSVQVAICTIEKANSLVNRLLEEGSLGDIGAVIVDEVHLLGDPGRGYLLELLLTKLRYMSLKDVKVNIQIIGMSATLPNLDLLAKWLDAELYTTSFRPIPLYEQCHVNSEIYDVDFNLNRKLAMLPDLQTDTDNVLQLCLETIENSCSVLIFCPTKNWCENLAQQIATAFHKLRNSKSLFQEFLHRELNSEKISEVLQQLKRCPVGLDSVLSNTVSFGVAFHHAGLTMDERDIIEGAFRSCTLRVLIATSTLSSGVNLPARRVIIRTPMFYGKPISALTYRQMIGRAGRMGKDTAGESLLLCQKNELKIAKELMSAKMEPIESCLEGAGKLKRAILEVIASGVASSPDDVKLFTKCTLLAVNAEFNDPIEESVSFLQNNEFIRLQILEDGSSKYVATSLAKACLSSSMPPEEGLTLFAELEKARQCFVLETELHLIYLVTPYNACNQWNNIDWMFFLDTWEKLPASMKRVGELVGVTESFMVSAFRGKMKTNTRQAYHKLLIHKRFYTALALQDLVNEVPLSSVAAKFNCSRGMLQSLQQSASTFAGMVTSFSKQLGWSSVEILISQFQDRLQFGISRELLDLMRLPLLNGLRARALYDGGIESLVQLASSDSCTVENILHKVVPFASEKERDGESEYDAQKRNKVRTVWITGKQGLTEHEAADMLITDARQYLQLEMGLADAKWHNGNNNSTIDSGKHSCFSFDNSGNKIESHTKITNLSQSESLPSIIKVIKDNEPKTNIKENELLVSSEKIETKIEIETEIITSDLEHSPNVEKMATNTLNWSNESLFENSFTIENGVANNNESTDKIKPNECVKNDTNLQYSFENKSYLDKAFASSFNLDTDSLKISTPKANTSNDLIANSQGDTCDSSFKNLTSSNRKRRRSSNNFGLNAIDLFAESPSKKKKVPDKEKILSKINSTLVISQRECPTRDIPCKVETTALDLTTIEIINVCDDVKLFHSFCQEIQQQNAISLSVACSRIEQKRNTIGENAIKQNIAVKNNENFCHESRQIKGVGISWGGNTVYYVSFDSNLNNDEKLKVLKTVLRRGDLVVKMFDCKEQIKVLKLCCDVDFFCKLEDPKVGSWLLESEEKEKNLQALALKYLPESLSLTRLAGSCRGVGSVSLELYSSIEPKVRSCVEAIATWHLVSSIQDAIAELDMRLLHTYYVETNSMLILANMELVGIGVNQQSLQSLTDTISDLSSAFEKQIFKLAGRNFCLSSPTEVAKILGMYKGRRVSTSKKVLERNEDPIANLIIQWRKLNSTLAKLVYPLLRIVQHDRIYGCSITHSSTGRISMHEPNLQNVPRDFEVVNPITKEPVVVNCRRVFTPPPNFLIFSADYCQLELRLLAHLSKDSTLCSIMRTKQDVFRSIAAKLNNVEESEVTDQLRQRAKQICYGIIYGMGLKLLAEQLGTTEADANEFSVAFHIKYPGIKKFIQETLNGCKENGYVETIAGRRRNLPNINHQHSAVRSQAERQAVNTTIQGSAADIAKNAMVLVDNRLKEKFINSKHKPRLILHLHDELLYEVPMKYIRLVGKIIKDAMESSVKLSIPFPVKVKCGDSWGNLQEINL